MKERIIEFPGYLEPKPELSKWNYLWMLAILAGVAGLWFVAYTSMIRQGFEPFPAACLSSLIEIGTFGAGFNLVQGNKMTWFEIVVGLVTSALYNYVHIRAINIQAVTKVADTDWLLLGIYGVGPLLITFSAALWVGREVHKHKEAQKAWRDGGKKFIADEEQKAVVIQQETNQKEEEARIRQEESARQERERAAQMQMQLDFQKEKLRQEEETKREIARLEEERKEKVARARIEAKERAKSEGANVATNVANNRGIPTFGRGYDGFVQYVHWLESQGRTFDKASAAQDLNRSTRQIERYIEEGRSNGIADQLN